MKENITNIQSFFAHTVWVKSSEKPMCSNPSCYGSNSWDGQSKLHDAVLGFEIEWGNCGEGEWGVAA